jgi:hypothetical protein
LSFAAIGGWQEPIRRGRWQSSQTILNDAIPLRIAEWLKTGRPAVPSGKNRE